MLRPANARSVVAALLILGLAPACPRQLRKDDTVCPEYRDLRCVTTPQCSMDGARGCRVCACMDPEQDISRQPDEPTPGE